MNPGDIAALTVVAVCAVWLGWRAWRKLNRKGGCGCDHCPTGKAPGPTP